MKRAPKVTSHLSLFSSGWLTILTLLWLGTLVFRWFITYSPIQEIWRDPLFRIVHSEKLYNAKSLSEQQITFVDSENLDKSKVLKTLHQQWQSQRPDYLVWLLTPISERDLKTAAKQSSSSNRKAKAFSWPKILGPHAKKNSESSPFEDPVTTALTTPENTAPWWSIFAYRSNDDYIENSHHPLLAYQINDQLYPSLSLTLLAILKNKLSQTLTLEQLTKGFIVNPIQYNYRVWLPSYAEQAPAYSLSEYKQLGLTTKIVVVGDTSSQEFNLLHAQLELLAQSNYAAESLWYDGVLAFSIFLALGVFWLSFHFGKIYSTLFATALILTLWAIQWWLLTTRSEWIPTLELNFLLVIGWASGLLEKNHQSNFKRLLENSRVWGKAIAKQLRRDNQLQLAWETIIEIKPDAELYTEAYQLGQQCEQKREFGIATEIYHWLEAHSRGYEDCQSRLKRLDTIKSNAHNLGSTVAVDQHQLLPTEGLQPPALGRYRVEGVLGSGAMGVVYRGIDPAINRKVAIKTMALTREFEQEELQVARERFFREAETAGKLSHPNIVTIYDVGEEKDLAFIAMDLLTGVPLDEHVKSDSLLPIPVVYQLMIQITSAIAYAHQSGVVHRDIKPANLVYDSEKKRVIVTDFGIAHLTDHSKTRTGAILGSPYYMSPEQIQGNRIDGRSDVFSLGVTFYQLLTGELPFKGESLATVALHICNSKHPPIRSFRPELPASASRIINKILQKDRDRRYAQVEEVKEALINALKRDFRVSPYSQ